MKYAQLNGDGGFLKKLQNHVQEWNVNNYCTPEALVKDGKADQFFVVEVHETAQPPHDPVTQAVFEAEPLLVDGIWLQQWQIVELSPEQIEANQNALVPQEVSMAQCRLALYGLHGIPIETDEGFYALADILPEADRARARFELRTRGTVRYDNPLVIAFCAAMGWDRNELFIYGAAQ